MLSLCKSEVWKEIKVRKMLVFLKITRKTTYSRLQLTILFTTMYWYWGAKIIVLPPWFAWHFHFIFSTFAILVRCCFLYFILHPGLKKVEIFVVQKNCRTKKLSYMLFHCFFCEMEALNRSKCHFEKVTYSFHQKMKRWIKFGWIIIVLSFSKLSSKNFQWTF
jgi:hypothetical protein